jgi:hypothetical protein
MNTRGLTEIVILMVGLSAGILDVRLFSLMVLMAVVTTAATNPVLRISGHGEPKERRLHAVPSGEQPGGDSVVAGAWPAAAGRHDRHGDHGGQQAA